MSAPDSKQPSSGWYRSRATKRHITREENAGMSDAAWSISSRMIAGIILYGGLGWLLSRWIGHAELLIAGGALLGLGLSYVLVFRQLSEEDKRWKERHDSRKNR